MSKPEETKIIQPEDPDKVRERDLAGMDRDTTIRAVGRNAVAPNNAQAHGFDPAYSATHRSRS